MLHRVRCGRLISDPQWGLDARVAKYDRTPLLDGEPDRVGWYRVCAALNVQSEMEKLLLEVEGHVPQCLVAGDVNAYATREGGNYSDVLPLKAARRDSISNLTSCGVLNLNCRQFRCRFI